jgi:Tol biopolymer transport system component
VREESEAATVYLAYAFHPPFDGCMERRDVLTLGHSLNQPACAVLNELLLAADVRLPLGGKNLMSKLLTTCVLLTSLFVGGHCLQAQTQNDLTKRLEQQATLLEKLSADVAVLKAQTLGDGASRKGEKEFRAIYTVNPDGTDAEFLVAAPGMISSATPEWSKDGNMVAFDAIPQIDEFQLSHIFVYAVAGPFKGTMKDLGCGNVPSWSPDSRRIAFMLNGGNPCGDEGGIWIMNADGTGRRRIGNGNYARWSPDGKEICYHGYGGNGPALLFYNLETGATREILRKAHIEFGGATWSPDSQKVVFIALVNGKQEVSTIDVDGNPGSLKVLYREARADKNLIGPPSWSPDGKKIVLSIQETGPQTPSRPEWMHTFLYTMSATEPSSPALLEKQMIGVINRGMMWAPDGKKIIFSSRR